ncbi:MarR family winged helix-turn-helix transcriptional regulator [Streptomyces thermolilacinus]|uniref:Transcriptional regulator n=1 Tax=Streptomyces thermolilacinus SPC6 TaxID=1306406 RepID=A0A1D3DQ18_9ACTN|nr:MarR family transcriptional regulator [Streptomyces thermolilacinus]OEJ94425.1 transcriptional regulator [Streptomyces thermolilacinus SPC6]
MRAGGTGEEPVPDGGHGPGGGTDAGTDSGRDSAADGGAGDVPDQAYLALERELAVFLRRARASSGEMAREVHPELEPAAYGLLVRLDEAGGQRATELAGYFGVGKGTMSRQLRALEELGLIAREPDPADGRASLVRLTGEGRDRFRRVRDARRARYVRKLAGWDRAEVAELARLLHQLNTGSDGRDPGGTARP